MKNDELALEIERTHQFMEAAEALNSFVVKLNLDTKQNNELVRLMCAQIKAAEKGAFAQGVEDGKKEAQK
jgi:uncharacterized coiled-coil protein SlyX